MSVLQYIKKILRIKKKKPATTKPTQTPQRDLLKPTVRTRDTIERLKKSGLTDEEIEKLVGKNIRK